MCSPFCLEKKKLVLTFCYTVRRRCLFHLIKARRSHTVLLYYSLAVQSVPYSPAMGIAEKCSLGLHSSVLMGQEENAHGYLEHKGEWN